MGPRNLVTLTFTAQARNVEFARVAVATLAAQVDGFTLEELDDIRLVVSEAVTNAVLHAYRPPAGAAGGKDREPGETGLAAEERCVEQHHSEPHESLIRVEVRIYGSSVEVGVIDRGQGIPDVARARQPAFTTAPGRLGMGFTIMEGLCDTLSVSSSPGDGTQVWFTKSAGSAPAERVTQAGGG